MRHIRRFGFLVIFLTLGTVLGSGDEDRKPINLARLSIARDSP